jgi:hypothetical protein
VHSGPGADLAAQHGVLVTEYTAGARRPDPRRSWSLPARLGHQATPETVRDGLGAIVHAQLAE